MREIRKLRPELWGLGGPQATMTADGLRRGLEYGLALRTRIRRDRVHLQDTPKAQGLIVMSDES